MLIFIDKTIEGIPCKIPFKNDPNSPAFYNCTNYGTSKGFWCATSVNTDLTYNDWDWCDENRYNFGEDAIALPKQIEKDKPTSKSPRYTKLNYNENNSPVTCNTMKGHSCVFPFKYQNKMYKRCIKGSDSKHWCPIEINADLTTKERDWCTEPNCYEIDVGQDVNTKGMQTLQNTQRRVLYSIIFH